MQAQDIKRDAVLSECGQYRWLLSRTWHVNPARYVIFVMLNPSTADAYEDDPTIRRCISFAKREGFGGIHVANLFAGRATKPDDLFRMDDPEGSRTAETWTHIAARHEAGDKIVCAWGAEPRAVAQAEKFLQAMAGAPLYCLGTTKAGHPRHPLYLAGSTPLVPFTKEGE